MAENQLDDFDSSDGHLHMCTANDVRPCEHDCARLLWAIARDARLAIARTLLVCDDWDRLSKGPTGTTTAIRTALRTEN